MNITKSYSVENLVVLATTDEAGNVKVQARGYVEYEDKKVGLNLDMQLTTAQEQTLSKLSEEILQANQQAIAKQIEHDIAVTATM